MATIGIGKERLAAKATLAVAVFGVLFALLFQYRILALLRRLGADVAPLGTKLPLNLDIAHAPLWVAPVYQTIDYLNTVWFTTLLGLLIGAAATTFLRPPIRRYLSSNGWTATLAGAVVGLPNMFCTCCAATTLPALRRAGMSRAATLAFFVTGPSLNIVVILLAFQLLPLRLAIARTALGLIAALGLSYIVTRLARAKVAHSICIEDEQPIGAPSIVMWLRQTWETAKMAIPLVVGGIVVVSVLKSVAPIEAIARSLGEGFAPTFIAAALGTVLMVPTFTEVLWVSEFTKQGMSIGPAVALLITLPAVSLPSLLVLGRVFGSHRLAILLGLAILCLGLVSGLLAAAAN